MNLVLTYCWREWRAQRALLGGFVGLGLAALCLAFTLAPESFWQERGQRAFALAWFVVLGGGSVIAFAAPQLVRSEFGSKGDQFVRRMPGALRASFGGKLLFLLLAAIALPLLGLAVGQIFLASSGLGPADVFRSDYAGEVFFDWPSPIVWLGYGALLIPWVWAIGTWLPNGRMALGGTILFVLLLGLAVVPVLRHCPGLEKSLAYGRWCAVVPLLGVVVAAVSWIRGRLGGGALRSSRCGLLAAAGALVVPGGWLANAAYDYHHPDPQHLGRFETYALTPDLQFAWVQGSGHDEHTSTVPFRVDLRDGSARQLGGTLLGLSAVGACPPGPWQLPFSRSFFHVDGDAGGFSLRVLDLVSGDWTLHLRGDDLAALRRAAEQRVPEVAGRGRSSLLRAPGDVPVWFEGQELCFQVGPGRVERVQWVGDLPLGVHLRGHGFQCFGSGDHFDLTTRTKVSFSPLHDWRFFVRGSLLGRRSAPKQVWERRLPGDTEFVPVPELGGSSIVGLLDDDHVLLTRVVDKQTELYVWNAISGRIQVVPLPFPIGQGVLDVLSPLYLKGSLLPRDPAGRLWFATQPPRRAHLVLMRLDPRTRTWELLPVAMEDRFNLLAWPDANSALVQQHDGIDRVDLTTGARTRLFPRRAEGER